MWIWSCSWRWSCSCRLPRTCHCERFAVAPCDLCPACRWCGQLDWPLLSSSHVLLSCCPVLSATAPSKLATLGFLLCLQMINDVSCWLLPSPFSTLLSSSPLRSVRSVFVGIFAPAITHALATNVVNICIDGNLCKSDIDGVKCSIATATR